MLAQQLCCNRCNRRNRVLVAAEKLPALLNSNPTSIYIAVTSTDLGGRLTLAQSLDDSTDSDECVLFSTRTAELHASACLNSSANPPMLSAATAPATRAYGSIRQHTPAYVSIRRTHRCSQLQTRQPHAHTLAYVSIRRTHRCSQLAAASESICARGMQVPHADRRLEAPATRSSATRIAANFPAKNPQSASSKHRSSSYSST